MTEQHVVLEGSKRPSMADATRVADADARAPVSVTVTLRGKVVTDGRIPPSGARTPRRPRPSWNATDSRSTKSGSSRAVSWPAVR